MTIEKTKDDRTAEEIIQYFSANLHSSADPQLHAALQEKNAKKLWASWCYHCNKRMTFFYPNELIRLLIPELRQKCYEDPQNPYQKYAVQSFMVYSIENAFQINSPREWIQNVSDLSKLLNQFAKLPYPEELPLCHQLLMGEYQFLFGQLYPDLIPFCTMVSDGVKQLNYGLQSFVDEQGLPRPCYLDQLRSLLACWTRAQNIAFKSREVLFSDNNKKRFEWVVLQCLRWMRPDGTTVFSPYKPSSTEVKPVFNSFINILKDAFLFDADKDDSQIAEMIFAQDLKKKEFSSFPEKTKVDIDELPEGFMEASCFASEHRIAVLRKSWNLQSPALYLATDFGNQHQLDFRKISTPSLQMLKEFEHTTEVQNSVRMNASSPDIQMEFFWKKKMFFCGDWKTSIHIDDQKLQPIGNWHVLCQDIDSNYAYMEWELPLTKNYHLERLVLMIFKEDFLLLADTLLPNDPKTMTDVDIQYKTTLPLCKNLMFGSPSDAMELITVPGKGKRAIVYPVMSIIPPALPEWRSNDPQHMSLVQQKQEILQKYNVCGKALFMPLLFNLNEQRAKTTCTWRQLTVGENMEAVSRNRAVGYRIQLGTEQYIIYRSLEECKCRTLLGHHLNSEFMFASFDPQQGVHSIIEVERN